MEVLGSLDHWSSKRLWNPSCLWLMQLGGCVGHGGLPFFLKFEWFLSNPVADDGSTITFNNFRLLHCCFCSFALGTRCVIFCFLQIINVLLLGFFLLNLTSLWTLWSCLINFISLRNVDGVVYLSLSGCVWPEVTLMRWEYKSISFPSSSLLIIQPALQGSHFSH